MGMLTDMFQRMLAKEGTVSAAMVELDAFDTDADEQVQLLEEELAATKHALDVADLETARLHSQMIQAEKLLIYLTKQRTLHLMITKAPEENELAEVLLRANCRTNRRVA